MGYVLGFIAGRPAYIVFIIALIVVFGGWLVYYAYVTERDAQVYCESKGLEYLSMGRNIHAWVCHDPKTGVVTR